MPSMKDKRRSSRPRYTKGGYPKPKKATREVKYWTPPKSSKEKVDMATPTHKYEIIMYWSNGDDAFVAEVPQLPGCAAHGDTQEMALAEINTAMDLWIETAREFGDPIPEPKGERLMLA